MGTFEIRECREKLWSSLHLTYLLHQLLRSHVGDFFDEIVIPLTVFNLLENVKTLKHHPSLALTLARRLHVNKRAGFAFQLIFQVFDKTRGNRQFYQRSLSQLLKLRYFRLLNCLQLFSLILSAEDLA